MLYQCYTIVSRTYIAYCWSELKVRVPLYGKQQTKFQVLVWLLRFMVVWISVNGQTINSLTSEKSRVQLYLGIGDLLKEAGGESLGCLLENLVISDKLGELSDWEQSHLLGVRLGLLQWYSDQGWNKSWKFTNRKRTWCIWCGELWGHDLQSSVSNTVIFAG